MNILFLSPVGWDSIKQRFHFIVQYLDEIEGNRVTFLFKNNWGREYVKNDKELKTKPRHIPRLPFARFKAINAINDIIGRCFLARYFKENDVIIVGGYHFAPYIKTVKLPVVYDCCDDFIEFPNADKETVLIYERLIIKKAFLTVFSSGYLQKVVSNRAGFDFTSVVVNNAVCIPSGGMDNTGSIRLGKNGEVNITYIGAIFDWFDYELLLKITARLPYLHFHLVGPVRGSFHAVPHITFWGVKKHDDIFSIMAASDVLIMPFKLNDLILSVNPVKLYEYIYSGKAVVAIDYPETRKFEEYVYLYKAGNADSLETILKYLQKNNFRAKKPLAEMQQFAFDNTWEKRVSHLWPLIKMAAETKS